MYYSKNNIIIKLPEEHGYALLNPLSGSFDLLNSGEFTALENLEKQTAGYSYPPGFLTYLQERGYLYPHKEAEENKIRQEYVSFQKEIANSQVQLLLIPTYGCNLACTYCYQHAEGKKLALISPEIVDSFFAYAEKEFGHLKLKPFITLFGGEPLINSPAQRKIIEYIVKRCRELDYELAIVTNGFNLADYVELLATAKIKEIQITLDGSQEVHDQRRGTANGKGTFEQIVRGMEKAIGKGFPINFRSVVDRENIRDLVNLAEFLDSKGWLDLGPTRFKTQLGRNYELFDCYAKPQHLMSQAELWGEFAALSKEYPVLQKLHRPDFKGIRHLVDTGEMYLASFDTCPAAKTEWVFDLHGDIYGCTASCGREDLKLGTYYPEVSLNHMQIDQWQKRDVLNIEECRECKYNVICGGGCGVVALQHNGRVLSPDCRPIQEILDSGVAYYSKELLEMAGEEEKFTSGCMVCGQDLAYSAEKRTAICHYCGKEQSTQAVCPAGHFVCDDCHSKEPLELVEELCLKSELKDPLALALEIFELPGLNMHGPEYHSIVPAILVTAYGNAAGQKDPQAIKEALQRGTQIPGGVCGTHGACGAGVGTGIAYAIIHNSSPLSTEERGKANSLTAQALLEIAKYGGPRCCKRETILSIQAAAKEIQPLNEYTQAEYICSQFRDNKDCLKAKCPFFPKPEPRKG